MIEGYILGVVSMCFVFIVLTYFRRTIEHRVNIIEKWVENAGPKPKGFIVEPDSDADDARAEIIAKNKAEGRDTKLSELID